MSASPKLKPGLSGLAIAVITAMAAGCASAGEPIPAAPETGAVAEAPGLPAIRFGGTHPPDPAVLELIAGYQGAVAQATDGVVARDTARAAFISPGYIYHGVDGSPIDQDGFTARQLRNTFEMHEARYFDLILHQYENAALVTYKSYSRGLDRGDPFENYGSGMVIISREGGEWKVVSDILGFDPPVETARKLLLEE